MQPLYRYGLCRGRKKSLQKLSQWCSLIKTGMEFAGRKADARNGPARNLQARQGRLYRL